MSENSFINAEWARKNTQTVIGERVKEEIKFCEEAIKKAVADNKTEAYVGKGLLDSITLRELANRGFVVNYQQGDFRDPREHSYYVIKW